jgi:hypothetical protein
MIDLAKAVGKKVRVQRREIFQYGEVLDYSITADCVIVKILGLVGLEHFSVHTLDEISEEEWKTARILES